VTLKLKRSKGFSLIEVLVALVLLGVGLLGIARLQVISVRGNFFSSSLMQATYIAQDRLEFLRNLPFDSNQLIATRYNEAIPAIAGIAYSGEYTITDTVANELKTIAYTVTWNDGTNHRITFTTRRTP
jgi:type IV pilus assembly protein PilV